MCIIIAKNQGIEPPTDKIIENCFVNNPDGAGLAYYRENKIVIEKGFLTLQSLKDRLIILNFKKDDFVLYHFRIATQGHISKENCHPFPLSKNMPDLKKIYIETSCAIAHNGIFGNMQESKNNSDTQKFIAFILANLTDFSLTNPAYIELLKGYCGASSKLAFLTLGKIYLIGNFIQEKNGLYFSNNTYKDFSFYSQQYNKMQSQSIFEKSLICEDENFEEISHYCENCGKEKYSLFNETCGIYLCKKCWKNYYNLGIINEKWHIITEKFYQKEKII